MILVARQDIFYVTSGDVAVVPEDPSQHQLFGGSGMVTRVPTPDIKRLKLVACLVTGRSYVNPSLSPSLHRDWLRPHGQAQQSRDMEEPGDSGSTGATSMPYRHLHPL